MSKGRNSMSAGVIGTIIGLVFGFVIGFIVGTVRNDDGEGDDD